jgi:hypothetical protein
MVPSMLVVRSHNAAHNGVVASLMLAGVGDSGNPAAEARIGLRMMPTVGIEIERAPL